MRRCRVDFSKRKACGPPGRRRSQSNTKSWWTETAGACCGPSQIHSKARSTTPFGLAHPILSSVLSSAIFFLMLRCYSVASLGNVVSRAAPTTSSWHFPASAFVVAEVSSDLIRQSRWIASLAPLSPCFPHLPSGICVVFHCRLIAFCIYALLASLALGSNIASPPPHHNHTPILTSLSSGILTPSLRFCVHYELLVHGLSLNDSTNF